MALLQNDKAIFYHPLNDSTEALKTQAWSETTAVFTAGKVSTALSAAESVAFGTQADFLTGQASETSVVSLSATKFVAVYVDNPDSNHGTTKVGTVSGTDITYGAETEFLAGSAADISAATISATAFVIVYRDTTDSNHGTAKVGTVSGTDITFGAEAEFLVGSVADTSVAALSATKFVVAYRDNSDSGHGTAKVGTVSGTDITFGAETEFLSATGADWISVDDLSASAFVVVYEDESDSNKGKAKVGTVSGTDITFGAVAEFNSVGATFFVKTAALSSTKFVVVYADGGDSSHGTAKVGTISGTAITFGAETEFLSTGLAAYNPIVALDTDKFVVAYSDGSDASNGKAKLGTVSGTAIAFGAEAEFFGTGAANVITATPLSASAFAVAYSASGPNRGASNIGTLSSGGAALTASTPAAYDTAAAATKLAFAGWLKNPSA